MDRNISNLGKNIRTLRNKHKMTQSDLAKKSGVSFYTIVKIELDQNKNPKIKTTAKIADALDISIDELLTLKQ
jgi:transcriptional regulator with XRE-family HTH domain